MAAQQSSQVADLHYKNITRFLLSETQPQQIQLLLLSGSSEQQQQLIKSYQNTILLHMDSINSLAPQTLQLIQQLQKLQFLIVRNANLSNSFVIPNVQSLEHVDVSQNINLTSISANCAENLRKLFLACAGAHNHKLSASASKLNILQCFLSVFVFPHIQQNNLIFAKSGEAIVQDLLFRLSNNLAITVNKIESGVKAKNYLITIKFYQIVTGCEILKVKEVSLRLQELVKVQGPLLSYADFEKPAVKYPTEHQNDALLTNNLTEIRNFQLNNKQNYQVVTVEINHQLVIFLLDRKTKQFLSFGSEVSRIQNDLGLSEEQVENFLQSQNLRDTAEYLPLSEESLLESQAKRAASPQIKKRLSQPEITLNQKFWFDGVPEAGNQLGVVPKTDIKQLTYYQSVLSVSEIKNQVIQQLEILRLKPSQSQDYLVQDAIQTFNRNSSQIVEQNQQFFTYFTFPIEDKIVPVQLFLKRISANSTGDSLFLQKYMGGKLLFAEIQQENSATSVVSEIRISVPQVKRVELADNLRTSGTLTLRFFDLQDELIIDEVAGRCRLYRNDVLIRDAEIDNQIVEIFDVCDLDGLFSVVFSVGGQEFASNKLYVRFDPRLPPLVASLKTGRPYVEPPRSARNSVQSVPQNSFFPTAPSITKSPVFSAQQPKQRAQFEVPDSRKRNAPGNESQRGPVSHGKVEKLGVPQSQRVVPQQLSVNQSQRASRRPPLQSERAAVLAVSVRPSVRDQQKQPGQMVSMEPRLSMKAFAAPQALQSQKKTEPAQSNRNNLSVVPQSRKNAVPAGSGQLPVYHNVIHYSRDFNKEYQLVIKSPYSTEQPEVSVFGQLNVTEFNNTHDFQLTGLVRSSSEIQIIPLNKGQFQLNITFSPLDVGRIMFVSLNYKNFSFLIPLTYEPILDSDKLRSQNLDVDAGYLELDAKNVFLGYLRADEQQIKLLDDNEQILGMCKKGELLVIDPAVSCRKTKHDLQLCNADEAFSSYLVKALFPNSINLDKEQLFSDDALQIIQDADTNQTINTENNANLIVCVGGIFRIVSFQNQIEKETVLVKLLHYGGLLFEEKFANLQLKELVQENINLETIQILQVSDYKAVITQIEQQVQKKEYLSDMKIDVSILHQNEHLQKYLNLLYGVCFSGRNHEVVRGVFFGNQQKTDILAELRDEDAYLIPQLLLNGVKIVLSIEAKPIVLADEVFEKEILSYIDGENIGSPLTVNVVNEGEGVLSCDQGILTITLNGVLYQDDIINCGVLIWQHPKFCIVINNNYFVCESQQSIDLAIILNALMGTSFA